MSSSTHVIVYVHGIGEHPAGYSKTWFEALQPHLAPALKDVDRREVVWSDIVNAKAMLAWIDTMDVQARAAEESFQAEIEAELDSRKLKHQQVEPDAGTGDMKGLFWGESFSLDDFVRYMLWEPTREAILRPFRERPRSASARGTHDPRHLAQLGHGSRL